jgi:hypothetical protein
LPPRLHSTRRARNQSCEDEDLLQESPATNEPFARTQDTEKLVAKLSRDQTAHGETKPGMSQQVPQGGEVRWDLGSEKGMFLRVVFFNGSTGADP